LSSRAGDITPQQRRLVEGLTGLISTRLEATFQAAGDSDGPNVGIELRERNVKVVIEIPRAMLELALGDRAAREALRVRLKGRRDRMLFRTPPPPLPKHIAPMSMGYGGSHDGRGGQRGPRRR
jgi:hypothetical protein